MKFPKMFSSLSLSAASSALFSPNKSLLSPKPYSPKKMAHRECLFVVSPDSSPLRKASITSPAPSLGTVSAGLFQELQLVFRQFDANGDGKLSPAELGSVLRSLGDCISDQEATLIVNQVDADGDGYIDLHEFLNWNAKFVEMTGEKASRTDLRAAFRLFDQDRNGFISPDELHTVFKRLGDERCTMEDCCRMIKGVDRNGDGFVDFEEFKGMMTASVC